MDINQQEDFQNEIEAQELKVATLEITGSSVCLIFLKNDSM